MKREWNDTEEIQEHQSLLRRPSKKEVFNSYYFDKNQVRAPTRLSSMVKTKQMDDDDMEPLDPALPYDPADNVLAQNATTEALETTNRGNNPATDSSQSARNADADGGRSAARNLHQDSVSDNILANKQAEENAAKMKRRADYD